MIYMPLLDPPRIKVLSVRQPWAWLIVSGQKIIENRTWKTDYRGPIYIHAGVAMHEMPVSEIEQRFAIKIDPSVLQFGAIIGRVDLVDIVEQSDSPYFFGPYGWVLRDPQMMTPIPLRGMQKLFDVPASIVTQQPASPPR